MFVLFDNETGMFLRGAGGYGKQTPSPSEAKAYKNGKSAVQAASLHNVSRNVPRGYQPSHKYQNRPQVDVWELSGGFQRIRIITAPPQYLEI